MKRVFSRITAAILISVPLVGCGIQVGSGSSSGNVRTMALTPNENGQHSLSVVELLALDELKSVSGKFARFFFSPRIQDEHLAGFAPRGRFLLNGENVQVPLDDITLEMTTIYYHFQKLAALDEELGAAGVNSWPRDVGLSVRAAGGLKNNAFYDGKSDSMLVVPYTNKDLPISVNGGILAHEHFHSLFYKMVIKSDVANIHNQEIADIFGRDFDDTLTGKSLALDAVPETLTKETLRRYYDIVLTRGLNEGIADFWGWMYSGDANFIVASLPSQQQARSLSVDKNLVVRVFSSEAAIKKKIRDLHDYAVSQGADLGNLLNDYAYTIGTEYSRMLKYYTELYASSNGLRPAEARKEIAKYIVKMLPQFKQLLSQKNGEPLSASSFVRLFADQVKMSSMEECHYLAMLSNRAPDVGSVKTTECRQDAGEWKFYYTLSITDKIKSSQGVRFK